MTRLIPTDGESITAGWLAEMIGAPVSDFSVTVLEGGVVSDVFRIHDVRYASPNTDAPTSFVIKLATRSSERRQMAISCGLYLKELNFFRVLAIQTPIRSPEVYACVDDGKANPERFAILMEDLSHRSKVFDQVKDPPTEKDARNIALEAAKLHAHYWESDVTRLPWLGRADGRYVFPLDALSRSSPVSYPLFSTLWQKMYKEDLFDTERSNEATRLTQLLCGPSCDFIHDRIYDILSSRPKTLLHGDMRADNVFRSRRSPGTAVEQSHLTFIDWQLMHVGPPGPELTEAWISSLEPEVRRKDLAMLREYRDALVSLNPSAESYTYEMLVEDYSLSCCFWLTTLITAGAASLQSFDQSEGVRMQRLWEKMITRVLTAVTELSCLSRVEALVR